MSPSPRAAVLLVALAVGLIAVPFLLSSYHVFQATMVVVYAIALLGLNLLIGYNGQISLGHGAFFAIGAYTTAILVNEVGMPYWATVPIAGALCLVAGFLFGLPALRLEGLYLALPTFALAVATPQLLNYHGVAPWTGGVQGIMFDKPDAPSILPLDPDQWLYFFCLAIAVPLYVVGWNLLRGRTGRAIVAIRDQPLAAGAMGIDNAFYKTATFGVSAMYAGIAGALGAIVTQFVAPDSFPIFLSLSFLVGIVVGGVASISGAFFGAIFIEFVPNVASAISDAAPWAVYGVVLIGAMYLMPEGLAGIFRSAGRYMDARRRTQTALRPGRVRS
ncbi:MAG TPA: branched-chain amino acid ABC transporter permease [Stellaceae bacterium]|jgi:branched-chain amino acid transport system permease protein|nr:branched-chain amino acid ABC transporter permease [Stellaceae bacterium]